MEAGILIALLVLAAPAALVIWLVVRAVQSGRRIEEVSRRLDALESEMFRLKKEREVAPKVAPAAAPAKPPAPQPERVSFPAPPRPEPVVPPSPNAVPAP